jgi:hypothetical protein
MGDYAGTNRTLGVQFRDEEALPLVGQPSSGVTVTVKDDTDGTVHLAETAQGLAKLDGGTASSGTATTLTDSTKNWKVNQWVGKVLRLTAGTGANQERRILSNTATVLTIDGRSASTDAPLDRRVFATNPDATSQYVIHESKYETSWKLPAAAAGRRLRVIHTAKDTMFPDGISGVAFIDVLEAP